MKFSRKYMYAIAAPLTIGGLLATTAALPASAAARPAPRHIASGSMQLSGPLQYEQFRALQGFGRYHGQVTYTNWQYAEAGSGVYAPLAGAHALTFNFGGAYNHTLNDGLKLTALSPDRLAFSGTGVYSDGTTTWKIKGEVRDSNVSAIIAYDKLVGGKPYTVFLFGKVAANGSAAGFAKSSQNQKMTFALGAGTFGSVLHYHAAIKSDQIGRHDATFKFVIPASVAGLGGTPVTVKVHDGGWGARFDRYAHGVTGGALTQYPIVGGPGVTVR
jgi:hypothetical protein